LYKRLEASKLILPNNFAEATHFSHKNLLLCQYFEPIDNQQVRAKNYALYVCFQALFLWFALIFVVEK